MRKEEEKTRVFIFRGVDGSIQVSRNQPRHLWEDSRETSRFKGFCTTPILFRLSQQKWTERFPEIHPPAVGQIISASI